MIKRIRDKIKVLFKEKKQRQLDMKVDNDIMSNQNIKLIDKKFSRAVRILENEYALKKSMQKGMCIDKNGNPIPWYTYPAIEYLKQLDFSDKRVFEFGAGNSTFFGLTCRKRLLV